MTPVRFVFGLHLHQPVGNFDHVIREHVDKVYRPLLTFAEERGLTPVTLHVSGPLLMWLEDHDRTLHDHIGRLADEGKAELLTSGLYEPILAALPRADRLDQLMWMGEYLKARFGVSAGTAWLTERVFESDLIPELVDAGVESLLVDDWHLMAGGLSEDRIHGHYVTEGNNQQLTLVPIHERLRYLVPFQPAAQLKEYFQALAEAGAPLAVLGDDGEKFGGWPGTYARVWEEGWIEAFADVLTELRREGVLEFSTAQDAVKSCPSSGLAYVPTASYREMGEWALPPELSSGSGHAFTSAPWKNFLVRYEEANRMHKKALTLSALCRARGGPLEVQHAIGAAQSNDPYWHGVFGGIYMKHLRDAAWRSLASAESTLRAGEGLSVDVGDLDGDGEDELWVHSQWFSVQVGLRTGRIKEWLRFSEGLNYADVLTRRWEGYHGPAVERGQALGSADLEDPDEPAPGPGDGAMGAGSSIHDLEYSYVLLEAPVVDKEPRSLVVERVLDGDVEQDAWTANEYPVLWSWPSDSYRAHRVEEQQITIDFSAEWISKTVTVSVEGDIQVRYRWDSSRFPDSARLVVEVSAAHPVSLGADPPGEEWAYPIVTVPRSERGFERIVQGESLAVCWPVGLGEGLVELRARRPGED
ncbi:MAG: alpha-amylase/4-alpha-glucanotransferase domain-containing protein [Longimicrobiales bacterium]